MKKAHIALFILILLFSGCKKEKNPSDTPSPSYDKKLLLTNIGSHLILPSYQQFNALTDSLRKACEAFKNETSEESLIKAQNLWKAASLAWKQCELYKQGPAEDLLLAPSIDAWPVNTSNIETCISTTNTINSAYIEARSIYVKGLKAIEYLLFDPLNGNTAIINNFTIGTLPFNRKEYLVALAENLHEKALQLYDAWNPSSGNYLSDFIQADGSDVGSSLGKLVNQMVSLTDQIATMKLGNPLGKTTGTPQPSAVESPQSKTSLEEIKANLAILKNTFSGNSSSSQDNQGLDDLLNSTGASYHGQPLSQVILNKFDIAESKINAIAPTLEEAITEDPQKVEEAYNAFKDLLVILKADMSSSLGVLITYTDNDGD